MRSALAVPLRSEGHVVGVLCAYATDANAFREAHRDVMEAAAMAITSLDLPYCSPAVNIRRVS